MQTIKQAPTGYLTQNKLTMMVLLMERKQDLFTSSGEGNTGQDESNVLGRKQIHFLDQKD